MDIDEDKSQRLFEIKKNQLKMVRRRGYNIDREESLLSITLDQFLNAYVPFAKSQNKSMRNVLTNIYENDEGKKLYVYFADISNTKQLGVEFLDVISEMDRYKAKNAIIITPIPLSTLFKKKIQELLTYNIYTFMESEMGYDPTEHYLTPEHKALSPEEQRNFLSRNNISIDQMPIMLTTDMISRYYGFQTGQVIKINRINLYDTIIQNSVTYRVIKEDI